MAKEIAGSFGGRYEHGVEGRSLCGSFFSTTCEGCIGQLKLFKGFRQLFKGFRVGPHIRNQYPNTSHCTATLPGTLLLHATACPRNTTSSCTTHHSPQKKQRKLARLCNPPATNAAPPHLKLLPRLRPQPTLFQPTAASPALIDAALPGAATCDPSVAASHTKNGSAQKSPTPAPHAQLGPKASASPQPAPHPAISMSQHRSPPTTLFRTLS